MCLEYTVGIPVWDITSMCMVNTVCVCGVYSGYACMGYRVFFVWSKDFREYRMCMENIGHYLCMKYMASVV